jgi:glycosyltransferase involved in cell wall biosynthesis
VPTAADHAQAAKHIRILILTDTAISGSGGSERFLRNLLQRLPARDFKVTLVQLCAEPETVNRLHPTRSGAVESMVFLPIGRVYGRAGLRLVSRLRRMVRDHGFDILQSQHESSDVINALLPRGPAHARRISNRRDTGFLKSPRLRLLSRFLNRRYDRIVAPSRAILDAVTHAEGASPDCMLCIPNGVDTERFRPVGAGQRQVLRQALGFPADALLLGCVGSLTPVKRHADLLDAFAKVLARSTNAHLLLVGDGPLKDATATRAAAPDLAGHVHLLGQNADVQHVLQALDLFVLASETEGLSNAILEAMACGLPVVATRVGGNPEIVDAECGELTAPGDANELAEAMLGMLQDAGKRTRMGECAHQRILANYSLDSMARAYETLYRELAHAG